MELFIMLELLNALKLWSNVSQEMLLNKTNQIPAVLPTGGFPESCLIYRIFLQ